MVWIWTGINVCKALEWKGIITNHYYIEWIASSITFTLTVQFFLKYNNNIQDSDIKDMFCLKKKVCIDLMYIFIDFFLCHNRDVLADLKELW